jgi:DNA excision repair protein ERCC-4
MISDQTAAPTPTTPPIPLFPGTVLIDRRESAPFPFLSLSHDVRTQSAYLLTGDYSIAEFQDRVAIERKSLVDLWDTVLYSQSRQRFARELDRMQAMPSATVAVIVEGAWEQLLSGLPDRATSGGAVTRYVGRLRQACPQVTWHFCDGRRAAEVLTFKLLLAFIQSISSPALIPVSDP